MVNLQARGVTMSALILHFCPSSEYQRSSSPPWGPELMDVRLVSVV